MVSVWSPHSFMSDLGNEWLSDMRSFVHIGLPKLIFIALGAWLLVVLVNFVTDRIIKIADGRPGVAAGRAAQVRTLASVVRATGIGIVLFLAALQVMENVLNFNLAPLLASAGVAGVAIGLAAQTVVKDVLNGIFILIEDQYAVGEVVTLAGITGTIGSMTLRTTTVRGFDGTLYMVPNSQVTTVANQSREFSVTSLPISVDFSANPDEVVPLLTQIAMSVRNDPAYRDVFLEDPKVLGVDSIKGSEVIYPIQVRTLPRQQFDPLREMQRRIRLALEEHNMLPGSPYRIASHTGSSAASPGMEPARAPGLPDPTTAKPNEVNPFISG
jgi:moderate conductance mechanosensitive channel